MTIQEVFEAYREAVEDAHYDDEQFVFDPVDFNWDIYEEVM